jgi:hypothetical protein
MWNRRLTIAGLVLGVGATNAASEQGTPSSDEELLIILRRELSQSDQLVFDDLRNLKADQIYALKVSRDLCETQIVNCRGSSDARIKPLVDIELERRRQAATAAVSDRAFYVSMAALLISLLSLLVNVFNVFNAFKKSRA